MRAATLPDKPVLALTSGNRGFYIGSVKWRNQFLALFCLFAFFAFGVLYFRYWVIQKPFGIILFIGEGFDARTLASARMRAGGTESTLAIDSLTYAALLKNYSADSATPDSAAAATAIATGKKVPNGTLAVDPEGQPLANLLELARETGRMTGLITDGSIIAPTAASFYGHAKAGEKPDLARQMVESGEVDVVLGGGLAEFLPRAKGGHRADDHDLLTAARTAGYEILQTREELEDVPRWRRAKVLGLFGDNDLAFVNESESPSKQPTLSDMVRRGIELLQFHRGGYLLVVDAALMRTAASQGEGKWRAVAEFDRAISVAVQYTGNKSAIFVCSDVAAQHDNSSSRVPENSILADAKAGNLPPTMTESPPGDDHSNDLAALPSQSPFPPVPVPDQSPLERPVLAASLPVAATPDTAEDVLAFGTGLGADALHGVQENTALFEIIRDNL